MRMAARLDAMGAAKYRGLTRKSGRRYVWTGAVTLDIKALDAPHAWRRPRLIFVNSMSDLFQDAVPFDFIRRVWATMEATPRHTYPRRSSQPLDRRCVIPKEVRLTSGVFHRPLARPGKGVDVDQLGEL
jgi:protein gp37